MFAPVSFGHSFTAPSRAALIRAPLPHPAGGASAAPAADARASHGSVLAALMRATGLRIAVQVRHGYRFFAAADIGRFYAADKYACFTLAGAEYCLDESLTQLAIRLRRLGFMRVHRGELVQISQIVQVRRQCRNLVLFLQDGQQAIVSRRLGAVVLRVLRGTGE